MYYASMIITFILQNGYCIHLKLDYLCLLPEMFCTYSKLYLFDINHNSNSEFDSDYLLIHRMEDKVLHLGIVKVQGKERGLCHCNSFITTYVAEKDYDILYRDLEHSYEITKIVREDKTTKQAEVIYQSMGNRWHISRRFGRCKRRFWGMQRLFA